MANLDDKFDVLKGWEPGGDASVDQSFPPEVITGTPVTLSPGTIVALDASGFVNAATSPADVSLGTAQPLQTYVVLEGNGDDYSAQFVEKVVCLRGKLTVRTDKLAAAQSFPVGGAVSFNTGLLEDAGGTATTQVIGYVIANNVTADGTIDVELDL